MARSETPRTTIILVNVWRNLGFASGHPGRHTGYLAGFDRGRLHRWSQQLENNLADNIPPYFFNVQNAGDSPFHMEFQYIRHSLRPDGCSSRSLQIHRRSRNTLLQNGFRRAGKRCGRYGSGRVGHSFHIHDSHARFNPLRLPRGEETKECLRNA